MKFNSIKVVCLYGLVFLLFLFPAISRAEDGCSEVFKTGEQTIILNETHMEVSTVYLFENFGTRNCYVNLNIGGCELISPSEITNAVDSLNKTYEFTEYTENNNYCHNISIKSSEIKAGLVYSLWYSYSFQNPSYHIKIKDNFWFWDGWTFDYISQIPKTNKVIQKVKIRQAHPLKVPMISGTGGILPQPDNIYDELNYRVFVWDYSESLLLSDRIVKYINFDYLYAPDKNFISWSLLLLGIEIIFALHKQIKSLFIFLLLLLKKIVVRTATLILSLYNFVKKSKLVRYFLFVILIILFILLFVLLGTLSLQFIQ